MRMVGHCRSPCVQHAGHADTRTKMLAIRGNGQERLGRRLEQEAVDHRFILIGDVGDLRRQREHHVEVFDRQQVLHACHHPVPRRRTLTLRAVPVAAGVVGDVLVVTI